MKNFTLKDIGCWADGAFGHGHLRSRLADLVEPFSRDLAAELSSDQECWPDDLSDEDAAVELLQEHTADGLTWILDGDLILAAEEE